MNISGGRDIEMPILVSAHRIPHILRCQTLEVQEVRLRVLRLVSAASCKQILENLHRLIEKLPILHPDSRHTLTLFTILVFLIQLVLAMIPAVSPCYGLDDGHLLDLEQAFQNALANNPVMTQALASRKKAGFNVNRSISAFLPKVNIEAGIARSNNPVMVFGSKLDQTAFTRQDFAVDRLNDPDYRDNWQARIVMIQPLFNQGSEYIGYKTSVLAEDISGLGITQAGQAVLFMVEKAYCQALLAKENVAVLEAAVKTAAAHERLSRMRFESGLVLKSDVLSADVQKTSVERQLFKARNDFLVAIAALDKAMGVSQDKTWDLKMLDSESQDAGLLDSWLKLAQKHRPEILMAKDERRMAEYGHKQALFSFLPSFNLQGVYQQDRQTFADFGGDSWSFMATMSMNLFNGFGDRARISAASAETERKAAKVKEVEDSIELEVRKAFYGFQTAIKQLRIMHKAVRQAVESQRILRNRYENGLALMVELLAADTNVRETKLSEAKARFDARLAWSRLRWKAGILGRDVLSTVIDAAGSSGH